MSPLIGDVMLLGLHVSVEVTARMEVKVRLITFFSPWPQHPTRNVKLT